MAKLSSEYTHFVAIDFGTAGTGCAFSSFNSPDEIRAYEQWPGLTPGTCKTPTVLLLDPYGNFDSFGKKALDKYYSLRRSRSSSICIDDYYLFRQFKMTLYDLQGTSSDIKVQASNGNSLPAVTVFALSLKYLKDTVIKWLDEFYKHPTAKFLWILTVPAIWSHGAKRIMRLAAEKVFFNDEKSNPHGSVIFALEPEAAALHCILQKDLLLTPQIVKSYLIVDCGGGTIDIVAHKMTKNDSGEISIEELVCPYGNSSGGFEVNYEFEQLFCELCNLSVQDMDEIKKKYSKLWNKILDAFELGKTYANPDPSEIFDTYIEIDNKICQYIEEKANKTMEQLAKEYKDYKVEWNDKDNGLSLPYTTMYSLFQPVLSRINEVIKKVLQKSECNEIDEIILVGGFATSPLLSQEISSLFPNMTVKQNKDALTAVLKGAVKYGIHHKLIKSRKIPLSIGIELCVLFVQGIHDEHLKISINGKDYCKGVFLQCIKINESIKQDVVFERNFQPIDNASYCRFTVYGSQSDSVKYVTNRECYPIAHFEIGDLSPLQENRMIRITLRLGGTEMKVSACSAIHDDIKLFVKSVDAVHGTTLGLAETVNIDVRSL